MFKLYIPNYKDYNEEEIFRIKESAPNDSMVKVNGIYLSRGYKRNEWVKLSYNGKNVYRIIRGSNVRDLVKDKLWISYDSELELGVQIRQECEIKLMKASWFEQYIIAPWNTPNIVERNLFRTATIMGLTGLFLGVLS